jgi:hypothetical protein
MRMISANKLNRLWKNGVVAKMVAKTKVLKTVEEIAANTNVENVAGATAVKELSNKLGNCSLIQEGNNFYIVGADAVRKKLGSNVYECPSKLKIPSRIMGDYYLRPMFLLTFGKNIKISSSNFDFGDSHVTYTGVPALNSGMSGESTGAFDVYMNVWNTSNKQNLLSRNSDGLIVNSGEYPAIIIIYYVNGHTVANDINIEWV